MTRTDLARLARAVFAVGFRGDTAETPDLAALRAFGPGCVVLFARNVGTASELRPLIAALRAIDELPPLIAVDQEGGRVARIGDPLVRIPSALALGVGNDLARTERLATGLGSGLAQLGVSVNFAPVADLALEPASLVIGNRSFGTDAAAVAAQVTAFARGLERGGVAATLKHFPGHGATPTDSHLGLPHVEVDEATLRTRELVPFAHAIEQRVASLVMCGHLVVPAFDPVNPATLSARVLTDLLRGELGFTGVVVTDCLEMDAVAAQMGTVAAAVAALAAGADLLLISHRLELAREASEAIVDAVLAGRLPLERLQTAATRVRALRERYRHLTPAPIASELQDARLAARAAVRCVRGDLRLRTGAAVSVISFEGRAFDGVAGPIAPASLNAALRALRVRSDQMRVPLEPDTGDIDLLLEHLPALGDREFIIVVRRADLRPAQRDAVERILARVPRAIVVSAREPYDLELWPRAERVASLCGDDEAAFAGCADVLMGRDVEHS